MVLSFIACFSVYKYLCKKYLAISAAKAVWKQKPLSNPWQEPMSIKLMPVCHIDFGGFGENVGLHFLFL